MIIINYIKIIKIYPYHLIKINDNQYINYKDKYVYHKEIHINRYWKEIEFEEDKSTKY